MVVARFVKWSGAHIAVKPGQTPSTGYMRMLLFQHYAGAYAAHASIGLVGEACRSVARRTGDEKGSTYGTENDWV